MMANQMELGKQQMELERKTAGMVRAAKQADGLAEQLQELKVERDEERATALAISASMTRQYKAMQDDLNRKVADMAQAEVQLRDELARAREDVTLATMSSEKALEAKDVELAELRAQQEQMAAEFADMLKSTLDQMSRRIDVGGGADVPAEDAVGDAALSGKLEAFSLGFAVS